MSALARVLVRHLRATASLATYIADEAMSFDIALDRTLPAMAVFEVDSVAIVQTIRRRTVDFQIMTGAGELDSLLAIIAILDGLFDDKRGYTIGSGGDTLYVGESLSVPGSGPLQGTAAEPWEAHAQYSFIVTG